MMFSDNFFKKIQQKTNVDKDTIMGLASKLQKNSLKDETTLREIIQQLSKMTGKNVPKEQEDKIINTIITNKVPKDIGKDFDKFTS